MIDANPVFNGTQTIIPYLYQKPTAKNRFQYLYFDFSSAFASGICHGRCDYASIAAKVFCLAFPILFIAEVVFDLVACPFIWIANLLYPLPLEKSVPVFAPPPPSTAALTPLPLPLEAQPSVSLLPEPLPVAVFSPLPSVAERNSEEEPSDDNVSPIAVVPAERAAPVAEEDEEIPVSGTPDIGYSGFLMSKLPEPIQQKAGSICIMTLESKAFKYIQSTRVVKKMSDYLWKAPLALPLERV